VDPDDELAEIWYARRGALGPLGKDPNARAASRGLLDDERRFVDLARSPIWAGEEREIISTSR